MKSLTLILVIAALSAWTNPTKLKKQSASPQIAASPNGPLATAATVTGFAQAAGPTPFIKSLIRTVSPANALASVNFTIAPKPGSVTRPVSVTYPADYLVSRGNLNTSNGALLLPVFGLYSNFGNSVTVLYTFTDGSSQQEIVTMTTAAYTDQASPCSHATPTILQARTNSTALSYDFIMLKVTCGTQTPMIIDTDGALRWVGTTNAGTLTSMFYDNSFFISAKPPNSTVQNGLNRMEFDGTMTFLHDYTSDGVVYTGHHNLDPGKYGMLLEVDTSAQMESVLLEVDGCGNVLKRWDFANIISNAMTAGGDNPALFVFPNDNTSNSDWFHMNAACYRPSDDSLIVSSRENFVICVDYETGVLKWILGDTTKKWYTFNSLKAYALALGPNTLPPIGQHAVSITADDNLLLFDNGQNSVNVHNVPAGTNRGWSSPRKYHIDTQAKVATELWNYPVNQTLNSPFCSSIYEDVPLNYLINYAMVDFPNNPYLKLVGLDTAGNKIFDYKYTTMGCGNSWNGIPIHLERVVFRGPDPTTAPGGWRVQTLDRSGSSATLEFLGKAGATYRVEYKNSLSEPNWQMLTDTTPQCSGPQFVTDAAATGLMRIYRVRAL